MSSKHAAKHSQKGTVAKFFPVAAAAAAIVVAVGIAVSIHPARQDKPLDDKPLLEVLQDDKSSDTSKTDDTKAIDDWVNQLSEEQKAELEIAYEASVADGYAGTMDDWIATEVQAHTSNSGNVVVVLPDGGEFTVEEVLVTRVNNDSAAGAKEGSDGEGQAASEQEDQSSPSSQDGAQSALIAVDTVVAHKGDKHVAVPVKILGNPGVLGLTFSISYDEPAMTLVGAENGAAFAGLLTLTHSRTYASGCLFTWDGVDIKPEQVRDGVALTLFFDVADDASGLHSIAVRGVSGFDTDLGSISLSAQDGSIVIE